MARSERGASLQGAATSERRRRRPFCLAPHGLRCFLALAGVARWVELARISTLRSRLGQRQKQEQRDPLQYFNSLLGLLCLRYSTTVLQALARPVPYMQRLRCGEKAPQVTRRRRV